MATSVPEPDCLEWSDDVYSVSELVNEYALPCIVRVAEGIYSTDDTESFSTGDCLKLHRFERVEKVLAYPVNSSEGIQALSDYKRFSSPILVPLDYRKKARVLLKHGGGIRYPTVEALLKDFPRYVEVGSKSIYGRHLHTREVLEVLPRSPIELIRATKNMTTKSQTLICRYDMHELELETDCRGDFSPVRDPTSYTFREIVDKFCLPQLVELPQDFVKDEKMMTTEVRMALTNVENFGGQFILDRVDCEYKALGTHRLDLQNLTDPVDSEKYRQHQAVVIIPFRSDAQFQVATNRETSIYESVISLNFRAELNVVNLGGLYMEVHGNNKSKTVDPDYAYPELANLNVPDFFGDSKTPPPIPPKRPPRNPSVTSSSQPTRGEVTGTSSKYITMYRSPPDALPNRPPRTRTTQGYNKPLPSPGEEKSERTGTSSKYITMSRSPPEVLPNRPSRTRTTQGHNKPLPSPGEEKKTSFPPPVAKKSVKPKPSLAVMPMTSSVETNTATSRETSVNTYLLPRRSKPTDDSTYEITDLPHGGQKETLPLASTSTVASEHEETNWTETLRYYSVEGVKLSLEQLGLGEKVRIVEQKGIDGEYLITSFATNKDLFRQAPFSLESIDMLKLQLFITKGKVPVRDK